MKFEASQWWHKSTRVKASQMNQFVRCFKFFRSKCKPLHVYRTLRYGTSRCNREVAVFTLCSHTEALTQLSSVLISKRRHRSHRSFCLTSCDVRYWECDVKYIKVKQKRFTYMWFLRIMAAWYWISVALIYCLFCLGYNSTYESQVLFMKR
jgi:hypothetical protein